RLGELLFFVVAQLLSVLFVEQVVAGVQQLVIVVVTLEGDEQGSGLAVAADQEVPVHGVGVGELSAGAGRVYVRAAQGAGVAGDVGEFLLGAEQQRHIQQRVGGLYLGQLADVCF